MNGNTLDGFQQQIGAVKEKAAAHGRKGGPGFAINGFVIVRDSEEEALQVLAEIQGKADKDFVETFKSEVQNAGASAGGEGMWANSSVNDLVQYNDGKPAHPSKHSPIRKLH